MYRIFVDTNIVFEHALSRKHSKACTQIFKRVEDGVIDCYASSASFFTLAYFLQKEPNGKDILKKYLRFIKTLPTDHKALVLSLNSSFEDIEDGFQYYTALPVCNYFITLNIKDYLHCQIESLPCLTPKQFLEKIL